MLQTTLDDVLMQVRARLELDDLSGAVSLIESLRSPDQADLFAELDVADPATLVQEIMNSEVIAVPVGAD